MVAPFLCLIIALSVSCKEKQGAGSSIIKRGSPTYPTLGADPTPHDYPLPAKDRLKVSKLIHELITKNKKEEPEAVPYQLTAPLAPKGKMKMLVIPGGEFTLGSKREGEGPPRRVKIDSFWMAETEMTWAFCKPFLYDKIRKRGTFAPPDAPLPDMVLTSPSYPWVDPWQGGIHEGGPDYPAMALTHHAASKLCQWLSAQTGHFYRLPTEAEWEYACRAGSTTDYHFGDDPRQLDAYGWHGYNSDATTHKVATRKPNAWGLYDMHGNVAEWVLDGHDPDYRASLKDGVRNPWRIPTKRYPRIVKGGSWDHDQPELRSAARELSGRDYKDSDPAYPKSNWYHSDGQHVGFRIVRPMKLPSADEMHLFWNTDWSSKERNKEDFPVD